MRHPNSGTNIHGPMGIHADSHPAAILWLFSLRSSTRTPHVPHTRGSRAVPLRTAGAAPQTLYTLPRLPLCTAPSNLLRNAPEHCRRSARLFGCTDPPADSHQLLQEVMRMASPGLMQVFLAKTHSVSCCVPGETVPGWWTTTGQASCTRPLFWTTCSFNNRLPNCLARKATHSAGCSTITMLALLIGWIRGARFATLPRRGTSQTLCA